METNKVIIKIHDKNIKDWYEDYEIKINSINGYDTIYRRIFYEKGYMKRVVIGFTAEERDLASNSIKLLNELTFAALEYGYKSCEKGHNLDKTIMDFKLLNR